jgi:hypothetical protein
VADNLPVPVPINILLPATRAGSPYSCHCLVQTPDFVQSPRVGLSPSRRELTVLVQCRREMCHLTSILPIYVQLELTTLPDTHRFHRSFSPLLLRAHPDNSSISICTNCTHMDTDAELWLIFVFLSLFSIKSVWIILDASGLPYPDWLHT